MTSDARYASLGDALPGAQFVGRGEQRTANGVGDRHRCRHEQSDFPPELPEKGGFLKCSAGGIWDRAQLFRDVLTHLDGKVMLLHSGGLDTVPRERAGPVR